MMNSRNILFGALLVGLAASAMAGDDKEMNMTIEVLGEDGLHSSHFMVNGGDLGFDLDEMQVGESRSIVDESGKAILVTRGEEGFSLNIDGETIELPYLQGGNLGAVHWIGEDEGVDSDINVHVMRDVKVASIHETSGTKMSGTTIMSPKPIDAATQQAIKSLLESAGYGSEVRFIDHERAQDGQVMIRKVERIVESPQS